MSTVLSKTSSASKKHLFISQKFLLICTVFGLSVIALAIFSISTVGMTWFNLGIPALALLFIVLALREQRRLVAVMDQINDVLVKAAAGETHVRVTRTKGLGELGKIAWNLNGFLDIVEANIKDMVSCFEHAGQGRYYRHAFKQGLPGEFSKTADNINLSLRAMQEATELSRQGDLLNKLHQTNNHNLRHNLAGNQEDLLTLSNKVEEVLGTAQQGLDASLHSMTVVEELSQELIGINREMQDTGRVATTLAGDSARITETVNLINEITAQTNLLALNAAIEAARAGEVGRGFAVVADEVRALAERTRQSTNEIREVVKGLTASIEEIVSSVLSLGDRSQRISDNVDGFRHSFEAVAEGAKSNIGHLHYARGLAFASLLKLDHIIFMQRGYRGLEARGADGSAVSHTDCRLGRWYYEGDGAALFGSLASFKQLEIPHQQVHGAVNKALVAARGDWLHDDQLLHTILIEMESAENASKQVMELLNRMVQEQSVT